MHAVCIDERISIRSAEPDHHGTQAAKTLGFSRSRGSSAFAPNTVFSQPGHVKSRTWDMMCPFLTKGTHHVENRFPRNAGAVRNWFVHGCYSVGARGLRLWFRCRIRLRQDRRSDRKLQIQACSSPRSLRPLNPCFMGILQSGPRLLRRVSSSSPPYFSTPSVTDALPLLVLVSSDERLTGSRHESANEADYPVGFFSTPRGLSPAGAGFPQFL